MNVVNGKQYKNENAFYQYKIIKDKKLIIETFTGDVDLNFFQESMLKEFSDPDYLGLKYGICDLKNASLVLGDKEIKKLFDFALKHDKNLNIKWATITEKPYQTAMSMIFELQAVNLYGYKVFSTFEAATKYLNINLNENDLLF